MSADMFHLRPTGEIPAQFSAVESSPQLPVEPNSDYWVTTMDSIIVNGKPFSPNGAKVQAHLDSGTSAVQAPRPFIDAIYGSIPGAVFEDKFSTYVFPCESTKVQVSLVFGGVPFPIHPIDMSRVLGPHPSTGKLTCGGSFTISTVGDDGSFLIGTPFLQNVYVVYNFGSWTSPNGGSPYMKLLSTTDESKAAAEFDALNTARMQAGPPKNSSPGTPATANTPGNPVTGSPATGNPGNPATGNPATGNPATGNPATGNPATGNPATGNPATGNPATGNPATGNPATGNPATGTPPSVNQPATNQPTVNQPTVNQPTVNQPTVNQPTVNQPIGNPTTNSANSDPSITVYTNGNGDSPDERKMISEGLKELENNDW
ncbi:hypothetical protein HGRIS_011103 [Hohenbuehelia grisea]|uniref:Peptidase A1 domain-containing protein n=1 Tax=Hohenbuehelia grisea TaxID=104357 RepID=A0ABR3IZ02_9AGAR